MSKYRIVREPSELEWYSAQWRGAWWWCPGWWYELGCHLSMHEAEDLVAKHAARPTRKVVKVYTAGHGWRPKK